MSTSSKNRTRGKRAAALGTDITPWQRWLRQISTGPSLVRIGLGVLAIVLMAIFLKAWQPPFSHRLGDVPMRNIVARVPFELPDTMATEIAKNQAIREVFCYYENRSQQIAQLRSAAKDQIFGLLGLTEESQLNTSQIEALDSLAAEKQRKEWSDSDAKLFRKRSLAAINALLVDEESRNIVSKILKDALAKSEQNGLLRSLDHGTAEGDQNWIRVLPTGGTEADAVTVEIQRVRIAEVAFRIRTQLEDDFQKSFGTPESAEVAILLSNYISDRLTPTLSLRNDLTAAARATAIEEVEPVKVAYTPGVSVLARSGYPLANKDMRVLEAEHSAWLASDVGWLDRLIRLAAFTGMVIALFLVCGFSIYYQFDRRLLRDTSKLVRLLGLSVGCIVLSAFASMDPIQAQIVPVVMCAITATIAYGRPLSLMLLCCLSLAITISLGFGLGEFVILTSAAAAAILLLDRIRSRTKPIYVGVGTAAVCSLTAIGVGVMLGHGSGSPSDMDTVPIAGDAAQVFALENTSAAIRHLSMRGAILGGYAILASLLMAGLLPLVEKAFQVQTDLSLLELQASHALLRQLAQRAPGTYNHSINVAAIAEAAAEAVGAHGLLTRVGAHFHDIGKMFKPNYFVENQSKGDNRHDTLQPAMSTLVIIAHVKDGADLARQHKLPQAIIDFIEQHHGTTLVEYFYRQATKKNEENPNGEEVSELNFRYPGPKPQTMEAAVLMLADTVESASRSLVEPTPSRIQHLVDQLTMKRLLDGQFDECGMTLRQLDKIKQSLVKTLTAIYHGRIKYPDQQSA